MNYKDLREFLSFLESKGELRRIKASVSCELEITEIADRVGAAGGPSFDYKQRLGCPGAPLYENINKPDTLLLILGTLAGEHVVI